MSLWVFENQVYNSVKNKSFLVSSFSEIWRIGGIGGFSKKKKDYNLPSERKKFPNGQKKVPKGLNFSDAEILTPPL